MKTRLNIKVNWDKYYIFTRQIHVKLYHQNTVKNHNQDIISRMPYLRNFGIFITLSEKFSASLSERELTSIPLETIRKL